MKERNIGVDIAKIVAIVLVVIHHISDFGLFINVYNPNMLTWAHSYIHSIAYSCVDVFALATGYLCISSRCKYSRLVQLWIAAVFWGVLLLTCHLLLGCDIGAMRFVRALVPVWEDSIGSCLRTLCCFSLCLC